MDRSHDMQYQRSGKWNYRRQQSQEVYEHAANDFKNLEGPKLKRIIYQREWLFVIKLLKLLKETLN